MAAMSLVMSGALISCSDKDDYTPGELENGTRVYFAATEQTQYTLTEDASSFSVNVYRVDDSESETVNLTITPSSENSASGVFSYPSSVTFDKGSKTASIVFSYDLSKLVDDEGAYLYDDAQDFLIKIDESSSTAYGQSELEITAVYPSPWTLLGEGTYSDAFDWVNEDGETAKVEFYQNDLDPNMFRITNPYEWDVQAEQQAYFQFYLLPPGSSYGDIEIPEDFNTTIVAYNDFAIEYYADYGGDLYLVFPGRFTSLDNPSDWAYNYVVDWQDNGLPGEIRLSPYYFIFEAEGGWNQTTEEPITIVFPGYTQLDTSVEVTYSGMLTKSDNSLEAVAYVEFGADVTEAKVALVAGNVSSDILDGIEDGSIESQTISASSQVNIPFDADNEEGKYTIVAVAYYQGEARDYGTASFKYTPATAETWAYVATGTYTFLNEMWGEDEDDVVTDVLDLYESEATPGKFKIADWMGADYPLVFTVADDGSISFQEQETGLVEDGYGMINVMGINEYFEETDYPSYLKDGVYNFAIVYFVDAGYFAYGYETFVPAGDEAVPAMALSAKTTGLTHKSLTAKLHKTKNTRVSNRKFTGFDIPKMK